MHPQTFLKTFWRMELRPQVFVAMSFAPQYQQRFKDVITPAIRSCKVGDKQLTPYRVDISKSGDSLLTDIAEGIAHSQLVLADVSTFGRDSVTGQPYRNGNVMYEVGLALACRYPSEVLLVRDDHDKFLFDVSAIPHATINFADTALAIDTLYSALAARLKEQKFVNDARVQLAIASLSGEEVILLKQTREYEPNRIWGRKVKRLANWYSFATARLLDKRLVRVVGEFDDGSTAFAFTPLGYIVHQRVNAGLRKFKSDAKQGDGEKATQDEAQDA